MTDFKDRRGGDFSASTRRPRFTAVDACIFALLGLFLLWAAWRVGENLHYQWDWPALFGWLARRNADGWHPGPLAKGLGMTVRLSAWATILAAVAGILAGLARMSRLRPVRMLSRTYIEIFRNLPPLVIIFIGYYFISGQFFPSEVVSRAIGALPPVLRGACAFLVAPPGQFAAVASAVVTLALYEGAYVAEIVRGAILSIEREQWDAARSLGLSRRQVLIHVIIPQAFSRMIPPLAGQFVSTIKDSAIMSVISIPDLSFEAMQIMNATYKTFEVWLCVAALYLVLTLTASLGARRLENSLKRP